MPDRYFSPIKSSYSSVSKRRGPLGSFLESPVENKRLGSVRFAFLLSPAHVGDQKPASLRSRPGRGITDIVRCALFQLQCKPAVQGIGPKDHRMSLIFQEIELQRSCYSIFPDRDRAYRSARIEPSEMRTSF